MKILRGRGLAVYIVLVIIHVVATCLIVTSLSGRGLAPTKRVYLPLILVPIFGLLFIRKFSRYLQSRFSGLLEESNLFFLVEILSASMLSLLGNSTALMLFFLANSAGFAVLSLILTLVGAFLLLRELSNSP
jgi:hypothetical protein